MAARRKCCLWRSPSPSLPNNPPVCSLGAPGWSAHSTRPFPKFEARSSGGAGKSPIAMPSRDLTVLANPAHGNGPTVSLLLAAEAIQEAANVRVNLVFPEAAPPSNQRAVIQSRRNPRRDVRIFLDARLGELMERVMLRNNDFRQHVLDIAEFQEQVQADAQEYVRQGLCELLELLPNGTESAALRAFRNEDIAMELNHGSRVGLLDRNVFYFYPCFLSDLVGRFNAGGCLDAEKLHRVRETAIRLESGYTRAFLPRIHTFSASDDWRPPSHANVSFTPLFRPGPRVYEEAIPPANGIYLMPSGTGTSGDCAVVRIAAELLAAAPERLAVYCPDPPPKAFANAFSELEVLDARGIPHEHIRLVIGRAGWGTLWECFNAVKVFVAIPEIARDDPEIAFNLATLEDRRLALCWGANDSGRHAWQQAAEVEKRIRSLLEGFRAEFNGETDGLRVMVEQILKRSRID